MEWRKLTGRQFFAIADFLISGEADLVIFLTCCNLDTAISPATTFSDWRAEKLSSEYESAATQARQIAGISFGKPRSVR